MNTTAVYIGCKEIISTQVSIHGWSIEHPQLISFLIAGATASNTIVHEYRNPGSYNRDQFLTLSIAIRVPQLQRKVLNTSPTPQNSGRLSVKDLLEGQGVGTVTTGKS
jgi:hypothetical protein